MGRQRIHMRAGDWPRSYGAACGKIGSGGTLHTDEAMVDCKRCRAAMARQVEQALTPRTTCPGCQGTGEKVTWRGGSGYPKGGGVQHEPCDICRGTGTLPAAPAQKRRNP